MGLATAPLPSVNSYSKEHNSIQFLEKLKFLNSMSQNYQQGVFSFGNGFERSQEEQQQQQIRRDKLRVQGFDPSPTLVGIGEEESGGLPVYESPVMLSEMFNFSSGATTATELLENQIAQSYRNPSAGGWFQNRQGVAVSGLGTLGDSKHQTVVSDHHHQQQQISSINAESAAAMQLFLMNPQQRSPSPSSSHHPPPPSASSTAFQGFHNPMATASGGTFGAASEFTWVQNSGNETNPIEIRSLVEGQSLSLSLSSHLEAAKAEELRVGEGGMLFFGQGGGSTSAQYQFKNFGGGGGHQPPLNLHGGGGQNHQLHVGLGSPIGAVNVLRNSKYSKAAQELLEEFCSVGRGRFKKNKFIRQTNTNPSSNPSGSGNTTTAGGGGGNSPSSSKDLPPLSAADRLEHQRRKVKLLSMLDEVDRRYNHYCQQMQAVVNSFDIVMGFGAAIPYTCLAQKAMSRHFRCLKDAIAAQLQHTCELLGEKDAGTSGVTKGETPRLKILEQSLRQQRAFHHMGMLEQEAWRPQRGLPERSINILRAWLFEHFLHPYPSDADKHLLARQTGLSKNQVSNWFINARVRLWKPMVEEMYQQEAKEEAEEREGDQTSRPNNSAPTPTPTATAATITSAPAITPPSSKRSEIYAPENDPSCIAINTQCFSENQAKHANLTSSSSITTNPATASAVQESTMCHFVGPPDHYGTSNTNADIDSTLIRFGTSAGDVSLTLGLRHAGNLPEKNPFSVRDFGSC